MHDLLYRGRRTFTRALASLWGGARLEVTLNYRHDLLNIPPVEDLPGCKIRRLGFDELPLLHQVWPVPLDKMRRRLRRGDRCLAAFLDGRIAHYQWVQTRGWHYLQPTGRWMRLRDGEFVDYHVRTAGWARGRHIDQWVKSFILQSYKLEGYRTAWVYTTIGNIASQKGIERAGWVFAEGYRALALGNLHLPLPGTLKRNPSGKA